MPLASLLYKDPPDNERVKDEVIFNFETCQACIWGFIVILKWGIKEREASRNVVAKAPIGAKGVFVFHSVKRVIP